MGFFQRIRQQFAPATAPVPTSRKQRGDAAEAAAVAWLQRQGLVLVQRNYKTPGRGGGEIDAIMRAADGTLVFVEVRQRTGRTHGGAAGSVGTTKRRRMVRAAQQYMQQYPRAPACRFDVMACEQGEPPWQWEWLPGAFEVGNRF